MHAYGKINITVHSGYASYMRGTKTAEVEGLWLTRDPNAVSKHPDNSDSSGSPPPGLVMLSFYIPSKYHRRDPHDII